MFVTAGCHEVKLASALEGRGLRSWRMVHLSFPMRFFVPSWVSTAEGAEFPERAFIMQERDLGDLLQEIGARSLRRLQYAQLAEADPYRLRFREITKVWSALGVFAGQSHFVFEDEYGDKFVHIGSHDASHSMQLLWPVPSPEPCGPLESSEEGH